MACSKLIQFFLKSKLIFVPFLNLLQVQWKIFDYKEIFFLFYVAKSISFEVISILKKTHTFAAKLIILWPLLQFLN